MEGRITLDYGSGGSKTSELISSILLPAFDNPALAQLGDGAVLSGAGQLVFSTDSFVVSPWRFPGGDIGKLSVCGTVNDLCMAGGRPQYLSLSFILEEGFLFSDLEQIVESIAREAREAGVSIVTGDTKVVESGKGDGIYINTAGIGFRRAAFPGQSGIRPGDAVLISGSAGCHGAAVMMARAGLLREESPLKSDCRSLHRISGALLDCAPDGSVRILRDPTRGGIATTLNEFTEGMPFSIELEQWSEIEVQRVFDNKTHFLFPGKLPVSFGFRSKIPVFHKRADFFRGNLHTEIQNQPFAAGIGSGDQPAASSPLELLIYRYFCSSMFSAVMSPEISTERNVQI